MAALDVGREPLAHVDSAKAGKRMLGPVRRLERQTKAGGADVSGEVAGAPLLVG